MNNTPSDFINKKKKKKNLVLDENGNPLMLFHGTTRKFKEHSEKKHRTVLNENYQGDWFCYSKSEDIAWKYAEAPRNQNIDKETFLNETEKLLKEKSTTDIHKYIYLIAESIMEKGFTKGWEIIEKKYSEDKNLNIDTSTKMMFDEIRNFEENYKGFDINDFIDILDYVEYSKSDQPDEIDIIQNFFNSSNNNSIPDSTITYLKELGYKQSLPEKKIIKSYIYADNILKTSSRDEARLAKNNGYDLVIYNGIDCVDGEPEYLIANKEQIRPQEIKIKHELIDEEKSTYSETYYDITYETKIIDTPLELDKTKKVKKNKI